MARQLSSRLTVGAFLLLAALASAPAWAYTLTGVSWPGTSTTYRINTNFAGSLAGTSAQQIDVLRCAAGAWRHQARSNFNFLYAGTTGVTTVATGDAVNAVFYSPDNPGGGTLATCFYGSFFGDLTGFDIVFWGQNDNGPITWDGVGDTAPANVDIAAVGTHEFGHALGLDHSGISSATMYAFYDGIQGRTLHSDDKNGVVFLYGMNPSLPGTPQINDVEPAMGPASGGTEVILTGVNFTWEADTILRVDGQFLSSAFYDVESPCRIRILSMPSHLPGEVSITVQNELGTTELMGAYTYEGMTPPPGVGTIQIVGVGAAAGETGVQVITQGVTDFSLAGYSYGVDFNSNLVQVVEATVDGTDVDYADFVAPVYNNSTAPGGGWWTIGVVFDISPPLDGFLPEGSHSLTRSIYNVSASATPGTFIPLQIVDGIGSPPVETVFTTEAGLSVNPSALNGIILVTDSPSFILGDGNRDGVVDIADPVYNLAFLFSMGPTQCLDAQDTNDDGGVDIADPIYNLSFLFAAGPPPLAPFPGPGSDPTADGLGCAL